MVYCVIVQPTQPFWCTRTYVLPAGQIVAVGDDVTEGANSTVPVVGGTGAYVGARGTVTSSNDSTSAYLTIRLR